MHRQINLPHDQRLCFRKKRQTLREGSRHASAIHAMHIALPQLAAEFPETGASRCPLKIPCKIIAPLTNAASLAFALSQLLTNPHARMVVAARGDALFGLADLGLGKCEACQLV